MQLQYRPQELHIVAISATSALLAAAPHALHAREDVRPCMKGPDGHLWAQGGELHGPAKHGLLIEDYHMKCSNERR